jgi:DNA polymerase-3 subunit alpha
MAMGFTHLRMHSEYSVVDGLVRIDSAVAAAANDGQRALALTDLANTFGFIKFYRAARAKGIKPILGVDVHLTNPESRDQASRALLLVQSETGYRHLCELVSRAWLTNVHRDRAEIRFEWFSETSEASGEPLHHGLICLSGGLHSEITHAFEKGALDAAQAAAGRYRSVFGDRFYLEVQRSGVLSAANAPENRWVLQTAALASQMGIGLVATHPVQFLSPSDFRSHEARVCIAQGDTLANPKRARLFGPDQYLKTQAEMAALFSDLPSAVANTQVIAARCNACLQLGKPQLPNFPTPNGESLEDYLRASSQAGLEQRLQERFPDATVRQERRAGYEARLALECDTIIQMGFPGYFLIVADFINWAKRNDVPVGPGRGSGAGSLVAYCLGITDLDPLPYALLFERFLNPERVSMPDFDIDFCQEKRQRVIDYVRSRYGRAAVSQIVTFGTMASRAVIRDAGRVLDLPYNFCDQLSKLIPVVQNKPLSLSEAKQKEPILAEREQKEEEVRELLAVAAPLEDLVRNVGMHAGGVLIAPGRLTDFCPLYQAPGSEGEEGVVSMYDKDDVEAAGLVKFDFLGLKNLTIIDAAVKTINRLGLREKPLQLTELNGFDDPAAYKVLKEANTTGIFQVESAGMRRYLLKLAPDQFEDIIAMLALYRPGPLNSGMVDDFIMRKRGQQKIDYFHPDLKECLSPTYGVIVYQEQVMQIAQIIAGYSLGGADLLRRAMGKKKPEEMAQQRSIFVEGATQKGHPQKLANELFDLMEMFAEYGFNKSHTAAYAVITYQTAWLKAHYPAEFLAATLSADMDDTDKVAMLVADARTNGLRVLPPSINASAYRFEPDGMAGADDIAKAQGGPEDRAGARAPARAIRYGLGAIRGVGESAVENIVEARITPFKDLVDFCARVDRRIVNRRAVEALIKAGAFDSLYENGAAARAAMLTLLPQALAAADAAAANLDQVGLFDDPASSGGAAHLASSELPPVASFSLREMLLEEKTALGYCFSGSLFDECAKELRRFAPTPLASLMPSKEPLWVAGVVVANRTQMTRRGLMRVVEIDDGSGRLEITVFSELFDATRGVLKVDEPLVVSAQISNDEYSGGLRGSAVEILSLGQARLRYAKGLRVILKQNGQSTGYRENKKLEARERMHKEPNEQGGRPTVQSIEHSVEQLINKLRSALVPSGEAADPKMGLRILLGVSDCSQACELRLGDRYRACPDAENLRNLSQALADEAEVSIQYD